MFILEKLKNDPNYIDFSLGIKHNFVYGDLEVYQK